MSRQDDRSRCAPPAKVGLAAEVDALIRQHAGTVAAEPIFEGYADAAPALPTSSMSFRVHFVTSATQEKMIGAYSTWSGVMECLRSCQRLGREVTKVERVAIEVYSTTVDITTIV